MLTTTLTRIAVGAAAATMVAVIAAPAAIAAPAPTFRTIEECNQAGINRNTVAGGAFSGASYWCEKTYGVPAGVAGCPSTAGTSGCIGEYYILRTRNV